MQIGNGSLPSRSDWLRRRLTLFLVLLSACFTSLVFGQSAGVGAPTAADIILKNARVYTDHDTGRTWSQAISIRRGNILAIGTNAAVEKDKGPTTRVIDLQGRLVLPGFNDAHAHFLQGGLNSIRVDLSGLSSLAKIQQRVKAYASENPAKKWILGGGWDQALLPGAKYPAPRDLDAAVGDRPVMLWHADHHALWVNTKGLAILKLEGEKGVLTGSKALEAANKVDTPSSEELKLAFKAAQENAARVGVTSVQGPLSRGVDELKVIEELYNGNRLTVRLSVWGSLDKADEFLSLKERYKNMLGEWVHMDAVKGYLDGVLGNRTAALLDPYADQASTRGEPLYQQSKLNELVLSANRQGLAVALHAIGDRAASMAVTAFANSRHLLFNSRVRNRAEHLEVVPPHIYKKFHDLGIVASLMPSHMVYENESQAYTERRVGSQRAKHAFAIKNFFSGKDHVAFGTDWPVMPLNPMIGLYAAVHRQHLNGRPFRGWQPSQKVTLEQALDAYTMGGAYATREEHVKGSLREGKYADIVVLAKDIFKLKAKDWLTVPVYMTIVNGRIVHDGSQAKLMPVKN